MTAILQFYSIQKRDVPFDAISDVLTDPAAESVNEAVEGAHSKLAPVKNSIKLVNLYFNNGHL